MLPRLLVSLSGGETSAYMTYRILKEWQGRYEMRVVFANTGQENDQTLDFVRRCDEELGFPTVWVESVTYPNQRKASGHRVVTFPTATRDASLFETMIQKYGIPNQSFPHCTRELKLNPIRSYLEAEGWKKGSYTTAIGIRADEFDRMSISRVKNKIIYPLIEDWPTTKPQVNYFWTTQGFRLKLKGYQGNCKWCWKKSDRKLFTLMGESPEIFDAPSRLESLYSTVGPEFNRGESPRPRTFWRKCRTTSQMFEDYSLARERGFHPASDDSVVFDASLDLGGGCEESCEVFSDQDLC